mgnify:CR=1 FL=1
MEEKTQDEVIREVLNVPARRTLRLPITIESRRTTAKGIFLQAMRRLARKSVLRHQKSLLDIAVSNSRVLSTLICTAKSNTTHQQGQSATEITHSLLSGSEEAYSLVTYRQKQQLCLLKLRLCLTDGVLEIHAEAPRFLWLQSALGQSHSNLLWYDVILASFLDAKV